MEAPPELEERWPAVVDVHGAIMPGSVGKGGGTTAGCVCRHAVVPLMVRAAANEATQSLLRVWAAILDRCHESHCSAFFDGSLRENPVATLRRYWVWFLSTFFSQNRLVERASVSRSSPAA